MGPKVSSNQCKLAQIEVGFQTFPAHICAPLSIMGVAGVGPHSSREMGNFVGP